MDKDSREIAEVTSLAGVCCAENSTQQPESVVGSSHSFLQV